MQNIDIIDPLHRPDTSIGGLPYFIIAGLELEEPAHLQDDERPLAKRLREAISQQGISHLDLVKRMKWTRIVKSLRLLDAALRGESRDPLFIRRAFECLEVPEVMLTAIYEEEKQFAFMRGMAERKRNAHRSFHRLGPHLTARLLREYRGYLPKLEGPYCNICAKASYKIEGNNIIPLSPEEVASAIREDVAWLPRVAIPFISGYIYHRLPDEAHIISPEGTIMFSGDWRCIGFSNFENLDFLHAMLESQSLTASLSN